MAGYSGKPLVKKLEIKPQSRVLTKNAPSDYGRWLGPLPEAVSLSSRLRGHVDVVHVFETHKAKLARYLQESIPRIAPDGAIWVSWPKKASKVPSDISEDGIREIALPLGLVDVKVCAVTDTWSGLRLVIRKELR